MTHRKYHHYRHVVFTLSIIQLFERIHFPDFLRIDLLLLRKGIGSLAIRVFKLEFFTFIVRSTISIIFFSIIRSRLRLVIYHDALYLFKKNSKYFPTSSKFHYIPIEILSSSSLSIFSLRSPPLGTATGSRLTLSISLDASPETRHRGEQRVQPTVPYIEVRSSRAAFPFSNEFCQPIGQISRLKKPGPSFSATNYARNRGRAAC